LVFVMIVVMIGVEVGSSVLVAQAVGANDRDQASRIARQSLVMGFVLALPLAGLGLLFRRELIGMFGVEENVAELALAYWTVVAGGLPIFITMFVLSGILRGSGDTKTPMLGTFIANILNAFFSWALIFGQLGLPEIGVAGSAWGSIIGWTGAVSFMLVRIGQGERPFSLYGRRG
jgi:putative MATE family efflux protein